MLRGRATMKAEHRLMPREQEAAIVPVTKPYIPPQQDLAKYLDVIYQSQYITNGGELLTSLQTRLEQHLGVKNVLLTCNATTALQVAYRLFNLSGTVITTPFSFMATTSSLLWLGLKPRFAAINPDTLNLDASSVESLISAETCAILPVHVFGNPCDVETLQAIASRHNLPLIYDAAHCFGVNYQGQSVLNWGDVSVLSLHATKLFHAVEGGALIIKDDALYERARKMINFGIAGPDQIDEIGINGKMSEFHAAVGHCVLDHYGEIEQERREQVAYYRQHLQGYVKFQQWQHESDEHVAYMPVIFDSEAQVLSVMNQLAAFNIFPKRYFYPSLDAIECYHSDQLVPVSRDVAARILCLPLYNGLTEEQQQRVIEGVISTVV
jgi:dTDP-4-amino-4,6-dideoxygalactose transaminase